MFRYVVVSTLSLLFAASSLPAEDWGHWRGPNGNGAATSAFPPTKFGASENVRWKVEIPGKGSGSPVVWGDRVFVVTAVPLRGSNSETLQFTTMCFGRQKGDLLWQQVAVEAKPHQGTHSTNGFASASPCTDGKHVYAHFGSRGLYCYTMDGTLVWKRDDFGQMDTRNSFGEGSSPVLAGDRIIVPWDHEGASSLMALDKSTGDTIWKVARNEPTCWATPLVIQYGGQQQIIINGQNKARSYDFETGAELWRCGGQTQRPCASAVASKELVFIGSGFRGSFLAAFRPDGKGDIEATQNVVWTIDRDTPDIASPLLSSGRLYFYKGKSGLLTCLDAATGKPHFTAQRINGINSTYASPIAAGGYVFLTGRSGTIVVIKDSPRLEVVATNSMNETVDATPAPIDGELFVRGERHLFCISN